MKLLLAMAMCTCTMLMPVQGCDVTWWYSTSAVSGLHLQSYKSQLHLEFSATNISLSSAYCAAYLQSENISVSSFTLACSRPGMHQVDLQFHNGTATCEDSIVIPVENSPYCYSWRAASLRASPSLLFEILLRVWVGDTEVEWSDSPSMQEEALSSQFMLSGESPSVSVSSPTALEATVTATGFNTSCSCWEFLLEADVFPYELAVEITGRSTVIMDCAVRSSKHLINHKKFVSPLLTVSPQEESVTHSEAKLYQDEQVAGVAAVVAGGTNFITQDNFRTIENFEILPLAASAVEELAFAGAHICVVVSGAVFTVATGRTEVVTPTGLPPTGVQHVVARGYSAAISEVLSSVVVAWSSSTNGSVFVSQDGGLTFEEVVLITTALSIDSLQWVALHPSSMEMEVLVSLTDSQAQFLSYALDTQTWTAGSFPFAYNGGNLMTQFFPDVFGHLLVWENTALYYSPNRGLTVNVLPVYTTDGSAALIPVTWAGENGIKHVALGPSGRFAVLSSHNRLSYGAVSVGHAVEIESGETAGSECLLHFDSLGELRMLKLSSGGLVSVRKVPTYSLLLAALYPPPACPVGPTTIRGCLLSLTPSPVQFVQWQHNVHDTVYYLDKQDTLTLWARVTPLQWQSNQLSFAVSDPSPVDSVLDQQLTPTAVDGSVERTLTVRLDPSQLSLSSSNATSLKHRTAVKLSVSSQSLSCQQQAESVALVAVECPPTRHIRVKRSRVDQADGCPAYENKTYRIPRKYYDPELRGQKGVKGNLDKEVQYDYLQYGCPISVPYTKPYRPVLELFDGDEFISEVDADFVVWELHGRTDFKYNATAKKAGCVSAPQSWSEKLESGLHPAQAWTQENYQHCYRADGEPLVRKHSPYEILNSTGMSAIRWYSHNGIYVMVATVIAKEYSFCNLTAVFAVEVYGATSNSIVGYLLLLLTCLLGLAALVATYFIYRHLLKTGKLEKTL